MINLMIDLIIFGFKLIELVPNFHKSLNPYLRGNESSVKISRSLFVLLSVWDIVADRRDGSLLPVKFSKKIDEHSFDEFYKQLITYWTKSVRYFVKLICPIIIEMKNNY